MPGNGVTRRRLLELGVASGAVAAIPEQALARLLRSTRCRSRSAGRDPRADDRYEPPDQRGWIPQADLRTRRATPRAGRCGNRRSQGSLLVPPVAARARPVHRPADSELAIPGRHPEDSGRSTQPRTVTSPNRPGSSRWLTIATGRCRSSGRSSTPSRHSGGPEQTTRCSSPRSRASSAREGFLRERESTEAPTLTSALHGGYCVASSLPGSTVALPRIVWAFSLMRGPRLREPPCDRGPRARIARQPGALRDRGRSGRRQRSRAP